MPLNEDEAIEMAIQIAKAMPLDEIIRLIQIHASNYLIHHTQSEREKLYLQCMFLMIHHSPGDAEEFSRKYAEISNLKEQIEKSKFQ